MTVRQGWSCTARCCTLFPCCIAGCAGMQALHVTKDRASLLLQPTPTKSAAPQPVAKVREKARPQTSLLLHFAVFLAALL